MIKYLSTNQETEIYRHLMKLLERIERKTFFKKKKKGLKKKKKSKCNKKVYPPPFPFRKHFLGEVKNRTKNQTIKDFIFKPNKNSNIMKQYIFSLKEVKI